MRLVLFFALAAAMFGQLRDSVSIDSQGRAVLLRSQYGFLTRMRPDGKAVDWTITPGSASGAFPRFVRFVRNGSDGGLLVGIDGGEIASVDLGGVVRRRTNLSLPCRDGEIGDLYALDTERVLVTGRGRCEYTAKNAVDAERWPDESEAGAAFVGEFRLGSGEAAWIARNVGGVKVFRARDGSIWAQGISLTATSLTRPTIMRLSADGKVLLNRRMVSSEWWQGPGVFEELTDGRVYIAGTTRSPNYPTTVGPKPGDTICPLRQYGYDCSLGSVTVFDRNLNGVEFSRLIWAGSRSGILSGRYFEGELQFVADASAGNDQLGLAGRRCGGGNVLIRMPLARPEEARASWLPAQLPVAGAAFVPGAQKLLTTSDPWLNWTHEHDLNQPEEGFCFTSSVSGQVVELGWTNAHYSVFFDKPRPSARLLLNGSPVEVLFQSPTQLNFRSPARLAWPTPVRLDGEPLPYTHHRGELARLLMKDPANGEALATDAQGRLVSEMNAPGPGETITLYIENASRVATLFFSAGGDTYRDFSWNFGARQITPIPQYPGMSAHTLTFPELPRTPTARRCRVSSQWFAGWTWCAIEYPPR